MDEPPAYTPQSLTDLLPIYRPPSATDDHIHTYTLVQTSPSTQTLICTGDTPITTPPLHIKTFQTGGFMNRKPHIIISNSATSSSSSNSSSKRNKPSTQNTPMAEARFDIHGTGTSISYPTTTTTTSHSTHHNSTRAHRLELEDSRLQILKTTIGQMSHWWQPFPGNKDVWELTNEYEDVIARFVHAPVSNPVPASSSPTSTPSSPRLGYSSRTNSIFSISSANSADGSTTTTATTETKKAKRAKKSGEVEVGRLHVVDALVGGEAEREEIVCSAVVVVERMRRRRGFLEGQASRYGGPRGVDRNGVAYIPQ